VQTNVASIAAGPDSDDPSLAVLRYTWLIFMLPHSVVAVSIATAYFTRMSTHARDGQLDEVRNDLSSSLRSIGLIIVFASLALMVVAFPFSRLFVLGGFDDILGMGPVLIAFLAGLVPFSILHVLRRTFYALEDTRTPFFITVFQAVLFVAGAVGVSFLPVPYIALGIAGVTTFAGIAQTALAAVLIRRRLGAVGGRLLVRRHGVFLGAGLVAALVGLAATFVLGGYTRGGWALGTPFTAGLTVLAVGGVMAIVYFAVLRVARNPEAAAFVAPIARRIRRSN
jgi:putative peptidoglycan lipid II flippase